MRQPLPLALFNPPCGCQTPGLEALESAGRPWRVAMTSPSLTGLWAAVSAGLGLTTRAELGLPEDVRTIDLGLPPLGNIPITLHRRRGLRAPNAMRFAEITEELVGTYLRSHLSERSAWNRTIPSPQPGWMVFKRKARQLGGQQSRQCRRDASLGSSRQRPHVALEVILVKLCL